MATCLNTFLLLLVSLSTTLPFSSQSPPPQKSTHLHLYFHEINAGPNKTTTVVIAPSNSTSSGFGTIVAFDDELREGPDPNSKLVGRAQGQGSAVSKEEQAYLFNSNFIFVEGEYNGSTLAVYGRIVIASSIREWSIIGGTGEFRLARGYVNGTVLSSRAGTLLIELDIRVL
ncbi:uncharacterized protein A4U43_C06F8630 [Asparagus officinalis]|uniref:Dirigent protein n=1 Tax=Asparagus officinalis TaxID=4686 RepID=A0A5P1EKI1_ASPOF|nr:uncharacterized protein A4U43_C06F8630 [Asparagus officinalis]